MTTKKGLFPNLSEEKSTLIAELIVGFIVLVLLYLIGASWSWYFLREETSPIGWIIYFAGGLYLLYKIIDKTFNWFKKIFLFFKKKV